MFRTRLISGIVLVALLLVFGIVGGNLLLAGMGLVSIAGLFELYRIFHIEKQLLGYVGYLAVALYYCVLWLFPALLEYNIFLFVLTLLILMMAVYVFSFPKYRAEQVMAAYFGIFYVAFMLSCVYRTRMLPYGQYLVWLIFLCSWGCDTCAYCVGMLIGKHKMSPILSPKKSVEGAVGGIVGTVLLALLYGWIFREQMGLAPQSFVRLAVICAIGALISMVGDLAASAIKRNYDVKDYGKLIPGHGGILDRFDSVIFTAPVIYALSLYL